MVSHYSFREIEVPIDEIIKKKTAHGVQMSIDFFMGDCFDTVSIADDEAQPFCSAMIRGLRTESKYKIVIKNHFRSFSVKFKPNGFYRLFGIPAQVFTNKDIDLSLTGILPVAEISEKLSTLTDIKDCVSIIETYLIKALKKNYNIASAVLHSIEMPNTDDNTTTISLLATSLNKSVRTMERIVLKESGLRYKTYCCLWRFHKAVKLKIISPEKKWTDIAYECGYYDQMHLIHDFKQRLNINPKAFYPAEYTL